MGVTHRGFTFEIVHRIHCGVGGVLALLWLCGWACLPGSAAPTTAAQARAVVDTWVKWDATPLKVSLGTLGAVTAYPATGTPQYFVVDLQPTGYVIVAADDRIEPIVAFVGQGRYQPDPTHPMGALVSRDLPGRLLAIQRVTAAAGAGTQSPAQLKWAQLLGEAPRLTRGLSSVQDARVDPLIQSRWNQSTVGGQACYNYYTPLGAAGAATNYVCGCNATAFAQVMRFHQHPTAGVGTPSFSIKVDNVAEERALRGGDGAGGPYDWANMPLVPSAGLTAAQRQAIGALCHDAGVAIGTSYAADGSAAFVGYAAIQATGTFQYTRAVIGYDAERELGAALLNMVNPNLDAGLPTLLGIFGTSGGHTVVCDGYGYQAAALYHHLNMGWAGADDAWYNLPTVDPSWISFTSLTQCVYNLFPTGTGEIISGRVVTTVGLPVAGATVTATRAGGGTYTATTNARGIYALAKIPQSSQYSVQVTKAGYAPVSQAVTTGFSSNYTATAGNRWGVDVTLPANGGPTASADSYTLDEDTALSIVAPGLLANDTDPNADPLTAAVVSDPAHGVLTLQANGSFLYTPATNWSGTDLFTYQVSDGQATSDPATVILTVCPVNDPPTAVANSYTVNEDMTLTVTAPGVLGNDTDPDGDPLTAMVVSGVSHGTLTLASSGAVTYTPAANWSGVDSFTYRVSDGQATSAPATVTLTVTAQNDPPVGVAESYDVIEDQTRTVAAPGVLGNDADLDGNPLTAVLVGGPGHGALTLQANGGFTYTPAVNWAGTDSFTYRVSDGQSTSAPVTVTLVVAGVNDPPVGMADSYAGQEDTVLSVPAPGVLANDTEVDGDPMSAQLVGGAQHGTVVLALNGGFTYTPVANWFGTDSFTYRISDGLLTAGPVTVTISVADLNDLPTAADDTFSGNEDRVLTFMAPGVLGNDTDPDGNPLSAGLVTGPADGTLILRADGGFSYTPPAEWAGTATFTYRASDGQATSALATVTLLIAPVNDPPVATAEAYDATEDTPLLVAAPGVLGNDTDAEATPLTAAIVTPPTYGTLDLQADGGFTYTPAADWHGQDTFTYQATDGEASSAPVAVTLQVAPDNDPPTGGGDTYRLLAGTRLSVVAPGVLGNDQDRDGDGVSAVLETDPTHGTLTFAADGSFSYQPTEPAWTGTDLFTYRASDGTLASDPVTVSLVIGLAPTAHPDAYEMAEDVPLTIAAPGLLANDTDPEGDPLRVTAIDLPVRGVLAWNADGSFTYTPPTDWSGAVTFRYTAGDGVGTAAAVEVTLTVTPVDDPPATAADAWALDEDAALTVAAPGVLANDADLEGAPVQAAVLTAPAHGTLALALDGGFTYQPTANWHGEDQFTYTASDGTLTTPATVTLTVRPLNDAPVAMADTYALDEDTVLIVPALGIVANDADVDGEALSATLVAGPAHGTLTLEATGAFSYQPLADWWGEDLFTYTVTDGTTTDGPCTVTLTVRPVNDPPRGEPESYTTAEDVPLQVAAPGVLTNDSDPDPEEDGLTAVLADAPALGTLTLAADGSFVYTPPVDWSGATTFTYRTSDGEATSAPVTVTLTVTPVDDAPRGTADTYAVTQEGLLTVEAPGVLGNDADPEAAAMTAEVAAGPGHGTLDFQADGSFTYTPAAEWVGPDTFTYRILAGGLTSSPVPVTVVANARPLAVADTFTGSEDQTLTVAAPGVLGNDTDAEGDPLTARVDEAPAHGTLTLQATGAFTFQPEANWHGTTTFQYRAEDALGASTPVTVTLEITPVNDPPTGTADAYRTAEDTLLVVAPAGVLANDADPDSDPLTATVASPPAHGTLTLTATGGFTYQPAANWHGVESFTYRVGDATLTSAPITVTLTVDPVNDPPVAEADGLTVHEDATLTLTAPGVLGNDTDADGDALTAVIVDGVAHGVLTLAPTGALVYTPATNWTGTDIFSYQASDGSTLSAPVLVAIQVLPQPDAPSAIPDAYHTPEDTPLTIPAPGLLTNDADPDGEPLQALLVSGPAHGTLALQADGSFVYQPARDWHGDDTFTYRGSDGALTSAPASVSLQVTAVDDAPRVLDDAFRTDETTALVVPALGVLANDADPEGTPITARLEEAPAEGTLELAADGGFRYTPAPEGLGLVTFRYRATDGVQASEPATVYLNINRYQVDGAIRPTGSAAFLGDGLIAPDGAGQEVTQTAPALGAARFDLLLRNRAGVADRLLLQVPAAPAGWDVKVQRASGEDVTAAAVTGWSTDELAPGASEPVLLIVTPQRTALAGETVSVPVTVSSAHNAARRDLLRARAIAALVIQPDLLIKTLHDGAEAYGGDDRYNADAAQTRTLPQVAAGATAVFHVQLQNDGNRRETLSLTSPPLPAGWWIAGMDALAAGDDITSALLAGTGWAVTLDPGATREVRVEITPTSALAPGTRLVWPLTVTVNGSVTDRVLPEVITSGALARVSVHDTGTAGDGESRPYGTSAISADGRLVAFASLAGTLVAGDTNGKWDVFVRDVQAGTTTRVSVAADGAEANGDSGLLGMAMSSDGRWVAYYSSATNLIANDTNGRRDAFLHDRATGVTTRVSVPDLGQAPAQADRDSGYYGVSVSDDGRLVAFESSATNLVAGDTNASVDIFVHDTLARTTRRVSAGAGGQANGANQYPALSRNGRYVVFGSRAANLSPADPDTVADVYLCELSTGTLTLASHSAAGVKGNARSDIPAISEDGRYLAFESSATNLVPGVASGVTQIYLQDRQAGTLRVVSLTPTGTPGNGSSIGASISADGQVVAFRSSANNLFVGDTNGKWDLFCARWSRGLVERMSMAGDGGASNGDSGAYGIGLSAGGRTVAFWSSASNLIPDDTNGKADVFVRTRAFFPLTGVTLGAAPAGPQPVEAAITLTAVAAGGDVVDYAFRAGYQSGGEWVWQMLQEFSEHATCTWTPTTARTWTLEVSARERGYAGTLSAQVAYTTFMPQVVSGVNLIASPTTSQVIGQSVTLTAVPVHGRQPRYKFFAGYLSGGAWVWLTLRDYTADPTCTWTPTQVRAWTLRVFARESTSTRTYDVYKTLAFAVMNNTPLSSVRLAVTPGAGAYTLTATPTGGSGIQYWYRGRNKNPNGTWGTWFNITPTYGTVTSCAWTPGSSGVYNVIVNAREAATPTLIKTGGVNYTVP